MIPVVVYRLSQGEGHINIDLLNWAVAGSKGVVVVETLQVLSTSNTTTLALLGLRVRMGTFGMGRLARMGVVGLVYGGSMGRCGLF